MSTSIPGQTANRPKTAVYIDGYNWYHAIFKHRPELKWLNVESFFKYLRSREDVTKIKVFSAWIDPADPASDARTRQITYFNALKSLPTVSLIMGTFQPREVTCRGSCRERYIVNDEKKTDVNIAVEMMADAISGNFHRLCVVSGDSDVQPVVEWISKNRPTVALTVYVPCLPNEVKFRRTDYYQTQGLNVDCRYLPLDSLKDHQLGAVVHLGGGKVSVRPHIWKAQISPA